MSPDAHRTIRALGVEAPGVPYYATYDEGPSGPGQVRLDLLHTGLSAGTELTFLKGTNPALHSRWDEGNGIFEPGEPSARYPVPFMGYMEVAEVIASDAPGFAPGDRVATTFGHKTGHTADPARDLLVPLPRDLDPLLGVFVAQMGPIAANGLLHADAEAGVPPGAPLGAGIAGRPVVVWGGGTVGLLSALFARRAGAEVLIAEPSDWRRDRAARLGLEALPEDAAWRAARRRWHGPDGRGADIVLQTRARADSLHAALNALRPQGTVIDLAFYQGGLDALRLGEAFHHNGLSIRCAQIARVPRGFARLWDRRRLAAETLALLRSDGAAIRDHPIPHIVPADEGADVLRHLPTDRPDFLKSVLPR